MSGATGVPVRLLRRRGAPEEPLPEGEALVDRFGRVHRDLRISVTDRCNFRCVYCMPEEGVAFRPREELLTYEEITRVARVAKALGVRSVRITGGEPLVRRDVPTLVAQLAAVGFEDLALTTNGTRLAALAEPLAEAGLQRVNVSCDSLRPERFAAIRRRGDLPTVLAAMDAAEAAGLHPLKVNVVLLAGVNDDEIVDFAAFARRTGRVVRFIEFMPLDAEGRWAREQVVPAERVLAEIDAVWPLEPVPDADPSAPAERYRFRDGGRGEIGVVASVTRPFCGRCDRLRLTADGAIRNCLFSDDERSVRELLRDGASDEAIAQVLRAAVGAKRAGHGMDDPGFLRPQRSMSMIGG
ncbi:GTP 3',8-cyclase MoaA [Aciditerrimonas ferrireducens]|jgi:cyclic pyranopterin phosphate synthase|uniref:GTP 3',8-cyclase MoaA n=1 Tax=Aciditerrimonas ferrireducens TaxID=667306 RepID=UPI002005902F|nr:GTP 3',8-cyclase MoaA [Aciditerrimonas ferrireducens]MCK4177496.1 GTP 3',8-cyclase MoaA [Aciditerrimonas ferrireducens]